MNLFKKTAATMAIALAGLLGAGSASADLIDFTDVDTWGPTGTTATRSASYNLTGLVTLTPSVGLLNFTAYDGGATLPGMGTGLDLEMDGVGIRDDEVNGPEVLTVTFAKAAKVNRLDFLDLYTTGTPPNTGSDGGAEIVTVEFWLGGVFVTSKDLTATDPNPPRTLGGYLSSVFPYIKADELRVFMAANTGKDDMVADAALAAVGVVPIPPAVLLFGSALLGVAGIGYRRSAKV